MTEAWRSLVHVCRRWRCLVFLSPLRLNLRLFCTPGTPARDTLDVWPALPLVIEGEITTSSGADNIIVALGQSNRVRRVNLACLVDRQLERLLAAMQLPFPELTRLELELISDGETPPVVPDSFLGGSAPHLQDLQLRGIPFPGLPNLLLSATHLVSLNLSNVPHSGYIPPEAMAALLSALSSLHALYLRFQSRPDWESRRPRPPPSKRSAIPPLTYFVFNGAIGYLEDLVTYIDAPHLNHLSITFFHQIDFDGPRLAQFISRTPILVDCDAYVDFSADTARVRLTSFKKDLAIGISCREHNRQLSSVAQVCNSCLPPLSIIESLYIERRYWQQLAWNNDAIENTLWLELLLPFPAVKNLCIFKDFAPGIAAALQEIVGTEVLPSLQNIFVDIFVERPEQLGPFQETIGQFLAEREVSGHSVTISVWDGGRIRRRS